MLRAVATQLAGAAAQTASSLLPQLSFCLQTKRSFNFIPYVSPAAWCGFLLFLMLMALERGCSVKVYYLVKHAAVRQACRAIFAILGLVIC
jgi:hypothetical protein